MRALDIGGLSVTMPHKADVLTGVDRVSDTAATLGAANCLAWSGAQLIADQVIVMEKGRIVQVGTHEELIRARGHYREAAELQAADEESKRLLGVEG